MATEAIPTQPRQAGKPTLDRFFEAVVTSNPFAVNRVSDPSQMESDVESIHAKQFTRLTQSADESLRDGRAMGALLLGGAGIGKSHMLARFARWAAKSDRACFVFLHNIQVSPQDMNRYLLKCCISKLVEDRLDRLHDTLLFRVVDAAIRKTSLEERITKLNDDNRKDVYQRLAARLGGDAQVFDIIFSFFYNVNFNRQTKGVKAEQHAEKAALAVRWLKGDLLDEDEARQLSLLVRPQQDVAQLAEEQVEAAFLIISRLASVAKRPFILCVDQVDNMKPEQLTALGQAIQPLIDHAKNLLVVVSGVREDLLRAIEAQVIPEAVADRLDYTNPIVVNRVKRAEAEQILKDRLIHFLAPFKSLPELGRRCAADPLFPLGADWFQRSETQALELRPRDVLSWANERWRTIKDRIGDEGGKAWMESWDRKQTTPPPVTTSDDEIKAAIDQKVASKISESVNERRLQPGSLPADAGNLLSLTKRLLDRCLNRPQDYTLRRVESRGKQQVDLVVHETRPGNGKAIENHVQFIVTGSKTSAACHLRKLLNSKGANTRVLVTDHDRLPLQLGDKGQEYLEALSQLGREFLHVPLSFEQYAQLDALESVAGQARSGDLEIQPRSGLILPVAEDQVIDSHHRNRRYHEHVLLKVFLTEEGSDGVVEPKPIEEKPFPPRDEFREFVLAQLSFQTATRMLDLLTKFAANHNGASDADSGRDAAMRIVLEMHAEELVTAQPWDDDLYLTIGCKAS